MTQKNLNPAMSDTELDELRAAKLLLENPGLAAKISSFVGTPIEKGFALLPKQWNSVVNDATRKAIETALKVALWTLDKGASKSASPSNWWHKLAAGASGAAGGALGLAAISIELPISTTIILRSIADIARSEGENLKLADAQLECVQVLALGGSSKTDDGAEVGYFAARTAMNTLFIDHFQDMARGHFIVRRLERLHGAEAVQIAYQSI